VGAAHAEVARAEETSRLAIVDETFDGAIVALRESKRRLRNGILEAAEAITSCFARDHKLLICGNGGSAAEAQHFATELVGRFRADGRPGLPAIALTADSAVVTAWANDVSYDDVFRRQVEALGRAGDVLVGLSTSGRSPSVVSAFEQARMHGIRTIALLGRDGGDLRALADVAIVVPSTDTQRIQEVQSVIVHLVSDLVERRLVEADWFASSAADRDRWSSRALDGAAVADRPSRRPGRGRAASEARR